MEMTENDKKKEFLRRYRECERREQEILEEIQRLRMDQMFPSMVNGSYGETDRPAETGTAEKSKDT